jgi:hypothetical protein
MDFGDLLGLVGALTGISALVVHVLTYRQNRAIIVVESQAVISSHLDIHVRNEGRHGVTLTDVGLEISPVAERKARGPGRFPSAFAGRRDGWTSTSAKRYGLLGAELDDEGIVTDVTKFLEPGRRLTVTVPMDQAASQQDDGWHSWPYATDFAGRTYYASEPAFVHKHAAAPARDRT